MRICEEDACVTNQSPAVYPALLFDADGTLLDFDRSEYRALTRVFQRHGYPFNDEIFQKYRAINSRAWARYEKGEIEKPIIHSTRFQQLFDEAGITGDGAGFNREYLEALSEEPWTMPGALELCQKLSKHRTLAIASNGVSFVQRRRLKDSGLLPCFSKLFISEEIGVMKPHAGFFDHVLAAFPQLPPQKLLIIGDSPTSDIAGGSRAGLGTCWVNFRHKPLPPGIPQPLYEVDSLEALGPLLLEAPAAARK
ncbi:noncanonical pyrimidine nucleotidase, YjjG family [Hydrogeniiclostridium mannosilyticum]|uniref:Noncanonical pyrimidine nucleotidase, YjjG family n=1 Tax=Hydrogeniiclostridium mannosilyticum TaxID=2764322 RepID=A0A328U997_9FIRM|nr:noncanonical pyrimidine nucleotidase, YjjG family [Hydrogeniiclostridium mannosilyticum]